MEKCFGRNLHFEIQRLVHLHVDSQSQLLQKPQYFIKFYHWNGKIQSLLFPVVERKTCYVSLLGKKKCMQLLGFLIPCSKFSV